MATTYFDTINGEITGEFTSGVQKDYMRDALGSVTGYVDANGSVVNRYWNKPYGAQLAKTGTGADPAFQWCGSHGYRPLGRTGATHDVRARDYDTATGRWTTADPLWPEMAPFAYVRNNPTRWPDPSGWNTDFAVDYVVAWGGTYDQDTPVVGIAAAFALPSFCAVPCPYDYIDFYIALHDYRSNEQPPKKKPKAMYEGGISFSAPPNPLPSGGWQGLMTAAGKGELNSALPQSPPPAVVMMTLQMDASGKGYFTLIPGNPPVLSEMSNPPPPRHPAAGGPFSMYGKILNASEWFFKCPTANSLALWGDPSSYGSPFGIFGVPTVMGAPLGPAWWAPTGYSTTDSNSTRGAPLTPDLAVTPFAWVPLASALRITDPMSPCDNSMFGVGWLLGKACCCS